MRSRLGWGEELTPVIISLAGFADARKDTPTLSLRQYLDRHFVEKGGEALLMALQTELEAAAHICFLMESMRFQTAPCEAL
jgi:hypothetical protein